MDFQVWRPWGVNRHFGGPIEEKVSDLGGLEDLEMHGFSRLEGVSDVIHRNEHFGGPIKEKVSDLGGLEGLEMHRFSGLEGCYVAILYCLKVGKAGR